MKKKLTFSLVFLLFILSHNVLLHSQENWEKHENNPVLTTGDEAMWDEFGVSMGAVLKYDDTYHLWYNGRMSEVSNWQIGYAWSDDGINWTKHPFPVITYGTFGNWDNYRRVGSVIRVNDTLKMWFVASKDIPFEMHLGYAWSTNGTVWEIYPEPVLSAGDDGDWDDYQVFEASVVFDGNAYHMWYGGYDDDAYIPKIGYASSADGINWTKDMDNNPVLEGGMEGSYLEGWLCFPNVLHFDGHFEMWFSGHDVFEHYRIGYAESEDGIAWEYITDYPVLDIGPNESWDDIRVCRPSVLIDEGIDEYQYKMWYSGHDGSRYKIGLALGDIVTSTEAPYSKSITSQAFPNPFNKHVKILFQQNSQTQAIISIINCNGQTIYTDQSELNQAGEQAFFINASDFKPGIYYYKITSGYQVETGKIIKVY